MGELTKKFTEKVQDLKDTAKYLFDRTSIEVAILTVLGLGSWTYYQTNNELKRSEKIPLAFSEIGQIQRDAIREGKEIWPIANYSMMLNDLCMKIFEAYNDAQRPFIPGKDTEIYARNIYDAYDLRYIYEYNLQDLLIKVPSYIPSTKAVLLPYYKTSNQLSGANTSMGKSWEDHHIDNYHTEVRTRTVTDADGESHIETYTEEVYDDTTHKYDYDKKEGERWAQQLTTLFLEIPELHLTESMKTASQTNADGEYAAEKSRNMKASERLDAQALLSIANTRYTGSTIMNATNHVKSQYPKLHTSSEQWNIAKKTAKSTHYKTYSHYDSGPKEFQVAETTYELGKDIEKSINEMLNAIQLTQDKVPLLNQKIQEFINKGYVHHATSEKEAKALGKEILSITKEIYKANFKQGVNVERFRWGMIFLFALIGGIIGAGFGFWMDYAGEKFNLYR